MNFSTHIEHNDYTMSIMTFFTFCALLVFTGCPLPTSPDTDTDPVSLPPTLVSEGRNNTMYQAFVWQDNDGLWQDLPDRAAELKEIGITSLWLPPAAKGMGGDEDVGYAVYDFWDLGEFDQKGTVATRYGTREELQKAIEAVRNLGMEPYFDVVFNHRMGADARDVVTLNDNSPHRPGDTVEVWTNFAQDDSLLGRQNYYTQENWPDLYRDFTWNWRAFNGIDHYHELTSADRENKYDKAPRFFFEGKSTTNAQNKSFGTSDDHSFYLMGADVDYLRNEEIRDEMKAWGEWLVRYFGFSGFRLDAVKHVSTPFISDWMNYLQDLDSDSDVFFVGEAWENNRASLIEYLNHIENPNMMVFDFPLREYFANNDWGLTSGKKEMDIWNGLVSGTDGDHPGRDYRDRAVTFVDNHDTLKRIPSNENEDYNQPQITRFKNQAYAYILMQEHGVPVVYEGDYLGYHEQESLKETLDLLITARYEYAYGTGRQDKSTEKVYSYVREGNQDSFPGSGLVLLISGRDSGETQTLEIDAGQANTTYEDFTGNFDGPVMTDEHGYGKFSVHLTEATGWSVWVPVTD